MRIILAPKHYRVLQKILCDLLTPNSNYDTYSMAITIYALVKVPKQDALTKRGLTFPKKC